MLVIYLLIWLFSPFVFRYYINDYLQENHAIQLSSDSGIRYNPFTSHLTVRDLELLKEQRLVFQLQSLEAEIRLHRLLFDELHISEFNLDGLFLEVNNKDQLQIAGIKIDKNNGDHETSEDNQPEEPSSQIKIILPKLVMADAKFQYYQQDQDHLFELTKFSLSDLVLSQSNNTLSASINAVLDDADLAIEFQANLQRAASDSPSIGQGSAELTLSIENYSMLNFGNIASNENRELGGIVSIKSHHSFDINAQGVAANTDKLAIKIDDLSYKDSRRIYNQQFQKIDFKNLFTLLELGEENPLQKLTLESLVLVASESNFKQSESKSNRANPNGLLFSNDGHVLALNNISLNSNDDADVELSFDDLTWRLQSLTFEQGSQLITSDGGTLELEQLSASVKELHVQKVVFDGLNAKYLLSASESLVEDKLSKNQKRVTGNSSSENSATAISSVENTTTDQETNAGTDSDKMNVLVDEILLINSNDLVFEDQSVKPTFSQTMLISEFSLLNLDSTQVNKQSPFKLAGSSGKYTKFQFDGFVKPFTPETNLSITGKLSELSLPPASPYIENALGFHFESGELDTTVEVKVVDSEISGNTNVLIKGLALVAADNYNKDALGQQTAMPLNIALAMLKDSDDNVDLDVPLTGNVDNPDFGMSSFFALVTRKAIQSAATSYLIKAFLPYAELVSISISAGDFILKTRFENLNYPPYQIEFDQQQMIYMQQFVNLMKDKKDTQVKVCAVSTMLDAQQHADPVSKEDLASLLKSISQQRMDYFKSFVVEQEIESARILLCHPKLDLEDKGMGRIEISI